MKRFFNSLVLAVFITTSFVLPVQAQEIFLPAAGVRLAVSKNFNPPMMVGVTVDPANPFNFNFLMDQGDENAATPNQKSQYEQLVRYFLAGLTVPEKDLWVNLSPYEGQRIIDAEFGKTEMGRDLLAQDYVLKQITSSLIYPEDDLGKKFWNEVYKKAQAKFGTTEIPVNTFNKVWIVPSVAEVYEKGSSAYVTKSHLKVMLEEDYLAMKKNTALTFNPAADTAANGIGSQVVREIVLPALEKEVNEGRNFANLRQINNALILAAWYKKTLKASLLGAFYVDQNKVNGVSHQDEKANDKIYQQYLTAFKKGAYNFIKEEEDPYSGKVIPRKYFSGGWVGNYAMLTIHKQAPQEFVANVASGVGKGRFFSAAMVSQALSMEMSSPLQSIKDLQNKDLSEIERALAEHGMGLELISQPFWDVISRETVIDVRFGTAYLIKNNKLSIAGSSDSAGPVNGNIYRIVYTQERSAAASRLAGQLIYVNNDLLLPRAGMQFLKYVQSRAQDFDEKFIQGLHDHGLNIEILPLPSDRPVVAVDITKDMSLVRLGEVLTNQPKAVFWRIKTDYGISMEILEPQVRAAIGLVITTGRAVEPLPKSRAMTTEDQENLRKFIPILRSEIAARLQRIDQVEEKYKINAIDGLIEWLRYERDNSRFPAVRALLMTLTIGGGKMDNGNILPHQIDITNTGVNLKLAYGTLASADPSYGPQILERFRNLVVTANVEAHKRMTLIDSLLADLEQQQFYVFSEITHGSRKTLVLDPTASLSRVRPPDIMEVTVIDRPSILDTIHANAEDAYVRIKRSWDKMERYANGPVSSTRTKDIVEEAREILNYIRSGVSSGEENKQALLFPLDRIVVLPNNEQQERKADWELTNHMSGLIGFEELDPTQEQWKELLAQVEPAMKRALAYLESKRYAKSVSRINYVDSSVPVSYFDPRPEKFAAAAMAANTSAVRAADYGGIDLTRQEAGLLIKRDGKGMPLPAKMQDVGVWRNLSGLAAVVTSITPVTSVPGLTNK